MAAIVTNLDYQEGLFADRFEEPAQQEIDQSDKIFIRLVLWQGFLIGEDGLEQLQSRNLALRSLSIKKSGCTILAYVEE